MRYFVMAMAILLAFALYANATPPDGPRSKDCPRAEKLDKKGCDCPRFEERGPHRGPEMRGRPEMREERGPHRGPEMRGRPDRGPEMRGHRGRHHGPEIHRRGRGPEMRGPHRRGVPA